MENEWLALKNLINQNIEEKPHFLNNNYRKVVGIGDELSLFNLVFNVAKNFNF